MEIGAILLLLTVIALIGIFISRPFFEPNPNVDIGHGEDHLRSSLLAEQDRLITILQELEFDHAMGKIPEEEYPDQRAELMQQGAEVLKKLDSLQPAASVESAEARIEKAVAARRAEAARRPTGTSALTVDDDDLERLISKKRQMQTESTSGFCPKCGKPILKSDKFCPRCGANLESSV